tara:strand:- start:23376 stop:23600 length:225 start_codon:yes stop_codon:yes gene_type:complete
MLSRKRFWLMLGCLIAAGISVYDTGIDISSRLGRQQVEQPPANQTTLQESELETLPDDVDVVTFQLIRNAIGKF